MSAFLLSMAFKFMGNFKQTSNPIDLSECLNLPKCTAEWGCS